MIKVLNKNKKYFLFLFIGLYLITIIKTAWLSDDAYITFRAVDNFINGHGLTWNTIERVQAFTNPLWMFAVSFFYFFTREIYLTSIIVSILISLASVIFVSFGLAKSKFSALLVVLILTLSKSFIDYSTSGLENALTHLLLVIFFFIYLVKEEKNDFRKIFSLALITALGAINRLDTLIIFIFPLIYAFLKSKNKLKNLLSLALGLLPLIIWELFAILYYGFPFPNTAYAKLNIGINEFELIKQGLYYLFDSLQRDPITLISIIAAFFISFLNLKRDRRYLLIGLGLFFYLIYIIRIGGDFMSGRFLSAPLLCATVIICRQNFPKNNLWKILIIISIIVIGLSATTPTILSDKKYGTSNECARYNQGIADERGCYYQYTGLLKILEDSNHIKKPLHPNVEKGLMAKKDNVSFISVPQIGFVGFYAGPKVYVFDLLGLSDLLTTRLPAPMDKEWRIGHFARQIPGGYLATLESGKNVIYDKNLSNYYDKISLIARGKIFNLERIKEIININLGKYDHLINLYLNPPTINKKISEINLPRLPGTKWDAPGNIIINMPGLTVDLGGMRYNKFIEISFDNNDVYQITYFKGSDKISDLIFKNNDEQVSGLAVLKIKNPPEAINSGFDKIKIAPISGDEVYSVGHVRLLDN